MTRLPALLACLLPLATAARAAQDAGLPGSYLNYAGGAQVNGMGRAFVGLAEGTDAVAWNPAGLSLLRPNIFNLMHTQTAEQARLGHIGYAQPVRRWGGFGLAYTRLDSGALPETNEFNQEVGNFRDVQETFMVGAGLRPKRSFSLGSTFKLSRQSISGASAAGWGLDLGLLGAVSRSVRLGLRIQNLIAPSLKFDTATDRFPRMATLGAAAKLLDNRLVLTADVEKAVDAPQTLQWRAGVEGTLWQVAKLRAGFDLNRREFTFGMGYLWGRYGLDFASSNGPVGATNRFGMTYSYGGYGVTIRAKPEMFSPVGLTKKTTLEIQVDHAKRIHSWVLQIKDQEKNVVHSIRGSGVPPQKLTWDGMTGYGMMVRAGIYAYALTVTDVDGRVETTPQQTLRVEYGTPLDTLEIRTK